MSTAADTSPEAAAARVLAYRRMGGHPEYDDGLVKLALARLVYGDDLVRRAWPAHELVDP